LITKFAFDFMFYYLLNILIYGVHLSLILLNFEKENMFPRKLYICESGGQNAYIYYIIINH